MKYLEMRNRTEPFATSLPGRDLYVTFTQDLTPARRNCCKGCRAIRGMRCGNRRRPGLEWTEDLTDAGILRDLCAERSSARDAGFLAGTVHPPAERVPQADAGCSGYARARRPIAGVLCLYFRDQVLPYYGGALAEYYKDSPNNFMYWNLMAQSCKEGFRQFDFGRSKRGTGSFHFKSAWSMQVTELPYRYHLVRAKEVPHLSPVDKKFQLPVAVWKRMPFAWTKVLGPRLIRWIPSI